MKVLESKLINGQPGSLRFRLARGTSTIDRCPKNPGHSGWREEPSSGSVTVRRIYDREKLSAAYGGRDRHGVYGPTTGAALAYLGHRVIGVDKDSAKLR